MINWGRFIVMISLATSISMRSPGSESSISGELEDIVTANSESLRRLRSAEARIEQAVWELVKGTDGCLSYSLRYSIWADGRKTRDEAVLIRDESKPKEILVSGPNDAHRRWVAAPADWQNIDTPEASFGWTVGSGQVNILKGQPGNPYGPDPVCLFEYVCVGLKPLREQVDALASENRVPTISDDVLEGVTCRRLEWRLGPDYPDDILRVWVAPSKGHMITRIEEIIEGRLAREHSRTLKEYGPGLFWFEHAEEKHYKESGLWRRISTSVTELLPNVFIDPNVFTMEGLGIPPGTVIRDRITGMKYLYRAPFRLDEKYVQEVLDGQEPQPAGRDNPRESSAAEGPNSPESTGTTVPDATAPMGVGGRARRLAGLIVMAVMGALIGVSAYTLVRRRSRPPTVVVLIACSLFAADRVEAAADAPIQEMVGTSELYLHPSSLCGPFSLYLACRYYGIQDYSLQDIAELASTSPIGTSMAGLEQACEAMGLGHLAVHLNASALEDILKNSTVVALPLLSDYHFGFVDQVAEGRFRLTRYPFGPRWRTAQELSREWKGDALLVSLTPLSRDIIRQQTLCGRCIALAPAIGVLCVGLAYFLFSRRIKNGRNSAKCSG